MSPQTTVTLSPPATAPPALGVSVRAATITFPSRSGEAPVTAVDRVSLDVRPGEFVALLGPSGCGKSTLLRGIAGLQALTSGQIELAGRTHPRRDVAFVFQDANLLPWRSVLDNVALPLELIGVAKAERLSQARAAIEQVGLDEATRRYPAQLSGGMKMRVSLARALVTEPKLLLLDEPFAALDEITRHRLDEMLRSLWLRRGLTVLFVTHSIPEAVFLADRAVVFTRRPARVLLDRAIDLPPERDASIRTDVAFSKLSRGLYEALVEAESGRGSGAGEGDGR